MKQSGISYPASTDSRNLKKEKALSAEQSATMALSLERRIDGQIEQMCLAGRKHQHRVAKQVCSAAAEHRNSAARLPWA